MLAAIVIGAFVVLMIIGLAQELYRAWLYWRG